jgi:hypothetical protein
VIHNIVVWVPHTTFLDTLMYRICQALTGRKHWAHIRLEPSDGPLAEAIGHCKICNSLIMAVLLGISQDVCAPSSRTDIRWVNKCDTGLHIQGVWSAL